MKIEANNDPSGQIGFYVKQRSEIIAEMDLEIANAVYEIELRYKSRIDDINQIINSTRSLLS